MNCKNCTHKIHGNFCSHCGHAVKLKRIDSHFIVHEIEHVLHFEKGFLFTMRELLFRPGMAVKEYVSENRSRLVKPIIFIIVTSLIYTLIAHLFHIEKNILNISTSETSTEMAISNWVHSHYGYANIIMGLFIACWLRLFFRKHDVNFFEILILLCFVMGIGMLFFALSVFMSGLTGKNLNTIFGIIIFIYLAWAIGQFFDHKKTFSYIKAGSAYILGFSTFSMSAWLLGVGYDAFVKHVL
jgi:hypothetical protein